ncbi:hypothetical protein [Parasphingorhabdus sp.]|uniref:hypothetical protein n=1 Tax=Parasphingorhabdus sp. TaxID=2709688 RepID=UPI003C72068D
MARSQLEIPGEAVALVEETERRHALGHGSPELFGRRCDQIFIGCRSLSFFSGLTGRFFIDIVAEPATAGQQSCDSQHRK